MRTTPATFFCDATSATSTNSLSGVKSGRLARAEFDSGRSLTHSVVELTAPGLGDELVTELADLGVENKALEINMSQSRNGAIGMLAAEPDQSESRSYRPGVS